MTKVKDLHRDWMKNPKYKAEYKALAEEFDLARTLIEARTHAGLSQTQLAKLMNGEIGVESVLRRKRIPFDQVEPRFVRETRAQQFREVAIDLHRDHVRAAREQFLRQRAGSGADLDDYVPRRGGGGGGDHAHEVLVDHEILPEPVPRLAAGLGEQVLDLVLGLRHRVIDI